MSFVRGNLSFFILAVVGKLPTYDEVEIAARNVAYAELEPGEIQRVSIVDPMAEVTPDFKNPYQSPVTGRHIMFDVIVERRVPEAKLVSRIVKDRITAETRRNVLSNRFWKMKKERAEEIKEEVEHELAMKTNPTISRISALVDLEQSIMLVSARPGAMMDQVTDAARLILGADCTFVDYLAREYNDGDKRKIVPFGISDTQSQPPATKTEWMREFVTWLAACSVSHDGDTETDDMMRITFPSRNGKTVAMKAIDGTKDIDDFCVGALSDGGVVKEFTMLLAGDFFGDKREEIRFKMNSTGYVSGINTGLKASDRGRRAYIAASGACEVAGKIGVLVRDFMVKRRSQRDWSIEASRIRNILHKHGRPNK